MVIDSHFTIPIYQAKQKTVLLNISDHNLIPNLSERIAQRSLKVFLGDFFL